MSTGWAPWDTSWGPGDGIPGAKDGSQFLKLATGVGLPGALFGVGRGAMRPTTLLLIEGTGDGVPEPIVRLREGAARPIPLFYSCPGDGVPGPLSE